MMMSELMNKPLDELELSVRASNCLRSEGLKTLGDLAAKTPEELMQIANFGKHTFEEITKLLGYYRVRLGVAPEWFHLHDIRMKLIIAQRIEGNVTLELTPEQRAALLSLI